jgi:hypothetical protein
MKTPAGCHILAPPSHPARLASPPSAVSTSSIRETKHSIHRLLCLGPQVAILRGQARLEYFDYSTSAHLAQVMIRHRQTLEEMARQHHDLSFKFLVLLRNLDSVPLTKQTWFRKLITRQAIRHNSAVHVNTQASAGTTLALCGSRSVDRIAAAIVQRTW